MLADGTFLHLAAPNMAVIAIGWGLLLAARDLGEAEYAALLVATITVAVGECFHTAALTPPVADLAPDHLHGRCMASTDLSWWLGLALAPSLGTQVRSASVAATFLGSAVATASAGASMLALDPRLSDSARLKPALGSRHAVHAQEPQGGPGGHRVQIRRPS